MELIKKVVIKDFDHFADHDVFVDWDREPLYNENLFSLKGENSLLIDLTYNSNMKSGINGTHLEVLSRFLMGKSIFFEKSFEFETRSKMENSLKICRL